MLIFLLLFYGLKYYLDLKHFLRHKFENITNKISLETQVIVRLFVNG